MTEHTFDPAAAVARLVGFDPAVATDAALADAVALAARVRAWVDAVEARVVSTVRTRKVVDRTGHATAAEWLSEHTGAGRRDALRRRDVADRLAALPVVADALAAGNITHDHAAVLARVRAEHHDALEVAQTDLVATASRQPVDRFARTITDWQRNRDHTSGVDATERRRRHRRLALFDADDAMTGLTGLIDPESADTFTTVLSGIAEELWRSERPDRTDATMPAVERTSSQRLHDALIEMARRASSSGSGGSGSGVDLIVTLTLDDLDPHGRLRHRHDPATLRRLACDARIIPAVFGGPSELLDMGRARRLVTPAQRRALTARDRGCTFPGCARPASWCQAHHIVHWLDHGPTDLDNLTLVCHTHHQLIHTGAFTCHRHPDGTLTWTRPDGTTLPAPRPRPVHPTATEPDHDPAPHRRPGHPTTQGTATGADPPPHQTSTDRPPPRPSHPARHTHHRTSPDDGDHHQPTLLDTGARP